MMGGRTTGGSPASPSPGRLLVAAGAGVAAAIAVGFLAPWQAVPLVGWAVAAALWALWTWWEILQLDAPGTAASATREDPHGATRDVLVIAAAVASLVAVVLGVIRAAEVQGVAKFVLLSAGVATIICSWGVVHTIFTLRYAALYYGGTEGGVDFNEDNRPTYADFAYLAFTVGMTFQLSDTDLQTSVFRRAVLRHALISYLFGAVILAATINLVASLAN
jgi:uncharacterized membrane protein